MNSVIEVEEFLLKKSEKLEQLCRVCLSENIEQAKCVYEDYESGNIASVMMLCARVQIVCQDGLPDIICAQCLGDLEAANTFRVRCELSDSLLRKVYSNSDRSKIQEKGEVTETQDVKEELSCEPWIKSELEDNLDSDDPLIGSSLVDLDFKPVKKRLRDSEVASKCKKSKSQCTADVSILKLTSRNHKIKSFVCKLCSRPLSSKKSLENHIRTMHCEKRTLKMGNVSGFGKDRKFNCSECPYSTPWRKALVSHSRTHTGEKPYKCDICQGCFTQPSSLSAHKRLHSDQMYFTCPVCGKQFKHKQKLESHKKVHSDVKNFKCELCSKAFKSKESLTTHTKRHLNIRDYSCEHCGLTFVALEDLINHAKKHTDVKKFECHICEFKTRIKRVLISHLRRHTGEKNFKCEICEFSSYEVYTLRRHMKKHTQEKDYSCPICQIKFTHSPSVNRHMLRIHKIEYRHNDHTDRRVIK